MTLNDNPVERLERICLGIHQWAPHVAIYEQFSRMLDAPTAVELMSGLSVVRSLPSLAAQHVEMNAPHKQFFLEWQGPVASAMDASRNLDHPARELQQYLTERVLGNLSAAARVVGSYGEGALPDGFTELRARADELRTSIAADENLPVELKRFLLQQIDRILLALREFTLVGGGAIENAQDAVVGAVVRAVKTFPDDEWTDAGKSRLREILEVLRTAGEYGVVVVGISETVTHAIGMLTG